MAPEPAGQIHEAVQSQELDDLAQVIRAYTQVTQRLERSHELLHAEVARLQKQLASTDAQLQRSRRLAALGEMAAGIAHEVRNPLAAIQLYAGMLADDLTTLAQSPLAVADPRAMIVSSADAARKIASAVRGLDAVVSDVLAFARELRPRLAGTPVSALLDRAAESLGPMIEQADIRLVRADAERLPGSDGWLVSADPDLIQQALVNLIRNAIDAMASSPGPRTLALDARDEGHQVVLIIRDTGPGIADEAIDRIFNPFFTTRDTGTGLGLAIVHRIVDAHGGAITVHNDHGAVFELSLPTPAGSSPAPGNSPGTVGGKSSGTVEAVGRSISFQPAGSLT